LRAAISAFFIFDVAHGAVKVFVNRAIVVIIDAITDFVRCAAFRLAGTVIIRVAPARVTLDGAGSRYADGIGVCACRADVAAISAMIGIVDE